MQMSYNSMIFWIKINEIRMSIQDKINAAILLKAANHLL
jgi:hypothetical protein